MKWNIELKRFDHEITYTAGRNAWFFDFLITTQQENLFACGRIDWFDQTLVIPGVQSYALLVMYDRNLFVQKRWHFFYQSITNGDQLQQIEADPHFDYIYGCGGYGNGNTMFLMMDDAQNWVYHMSYGAGVCVKLAIEPLHGYYLFAAIQNGGQAQMMIYDSKTGNSPNIKNIGGTIGHLRIDTNGFFIWHGHNLVNLVLGFVNAFVIKTDYELDDSDDIS